MTIVYSVRKGFTCFKLCPWLLIRAQFSIETTCVTMNANKQTTAKTSWDWFIFLNITLASYGSTFNAFIFELDCQSLKVSQSTLLSFMIRIQNIPTFKSVFELIAILAGKNCEAAETGKENWRCKMVNIPWALVYFSRCISQLLNLQFGISIPRLKQILPKRLNSTKCIKNHLRLTTFR